MGRGAVWRPGPGPCLLRPRRSRPPDPGPAGQEQVLANVACFHVGVPDAPLPIPDGAAAVLPGDHHHHRGLGHPTSWCSEARATLALASPGATGAQGMGKGLVVVNPGGPGP